jgi:hypothetical protein
MPGFVTKVSAIHTKRPSHGKIKPVAIERSLMGILLYLCYGSCYCQWMLEVKGYFGCISRTRRGFTQRYSGIRRGYSAICEQIRQLYGMTFSHFDHSLDFLFIQLRTAALRLIVRSWLDVPTFATRRLHARAPSGGRWNCGREMSGNFA